MGERRNTTTPNFLFDKSEPRCQNHLVRHAEQKDPVRPKWISNQLQRVLILQEYEKARR